MSMEPDQGGAIPEYQSKDSHLQDGKVFSGITGILDTAC